MRNSIDLPNTAIKSYSDLTGYDTAAAFTVTGDVAVKVVGVVGSTAITSTSGTTTISIGTTENALRSLQQLLSTMLTLQLLMFG